MDAVKYSADGCDRNIGSFSYRFQTSRFMQQVSYFPCKSFCPMQISGKELIGLIEFLSAGAGITPFMKNKIAVF